MKKIYFLFTAVFALSAGSFSQTITTFDFTGAVQTFTVPAGVTSVVVDCIAGSGGYSSNTSGPGSHFPGDGGRVETTLTVTPGSTLNIYVGGQGDDATTSGAGLGGYNGGGDPGAAASYYGGGGGGASDVRVGGTALTDRVVVAGGGGGAANNYSAGGDNGGDGGETTGQDGFSGGTGGGGTTYGTGGTPTAGGIGGLWSGWAAGTDGLLGFGGDGGTDGSGGGGGAGYYGGGGGSWSGGGGGSSYTDATLCTGTTHTQGYNVGDGQIVITVLCNPIAVTVTDDTLCDGDMVTLDGTGAGTITWDGGVTNGVAFTPPVGTTVYTATSSDPDDCDWAQTIFVGEYPTVDAGTDVMFCTGDSVMLNAAGTANVWSWDGGIVDATNFLPPSGTTTFTLTGTVDSTGCEATDMVDVSEVIIDVTITAAGTDLISNQAGGTYQWLDCPALTPVAGETSQTYASVPEGNYAVEVTLDGCVDTSACQEVHLGVENLIELGLNIYPIPASENLTLELAEGNGTFTLYSVSGEVLAQQTISEGKTIVDLNNYSSGMYIISFENETGIHTTQLIIE